MVGSHNQVGSVKIEEYFGFSRLSREPNMISNSKNREYFGFSCLSQEPNIISKSKSRGTYRFSLFIVSSQNQIRLLIAKKQEYIVFLCLLWVLRTKHGQQ